MIKKKLKSIHVRDSFENLNKLVKKLSFQNQILDTLNRIGKSILCQSMRRHFEMKSLKKKSV